MLKQIGVGVIGVGFMGKQHVEAYARQPLTRLLAVADVDEGCAREVAESCGAEAYGSAEELLARDDIEAVSICTSDQAHLEPTVAAAKAGKHILLEKPIATTLEDADTILAEAERAGVKLMLGFIVRCDPRYARVKEMIDAGELGELETVFARRLNNVGSQDVLKGRVSVLSFLGVHDFDIMRWMAGSEAVRVHTEAEARVHKASGYGIEDMTFTLVRFANGVIGCAEIGWVLPRNHQRGADFKLEAMGTRGVASIDLLEQGLAVCTEEAGCQRPSFGHSIDAEVLHFVEYMQGRRECLATGMDGRAALEISLAAQLSAEANEIVTLPLGVCG